MAENNFYQKLKSYNNSRKSVCPSCCVFSININTMTCMYQRNDIRKIFICPIELLLSQMMNAEIHINQISTLGKWPGLYKEETISRITAGYTPPDYEENSEKYHQEITKEFFLSKGEWKGFHEIFGMEISKNYYDSVQEQTQEDIERE